MMGHPVLHEPCQTGFWVTKVVVDSVVLKMAPKVEEFFTLYNGIKMPSVALGTWKVNLEKIQNSIC